MNKSQQKKLAKLQAAKDKKNQKQEGAPSKNPLGQKTNQPTEEAKGEETKQGEVKKEEVKQEKQPKQKQQQPPKKAPAKKVEEVIPDISQMDIRVGRIVEVWPNPASEKLYNEKIDIGNGEIRCIASGLQKLVKIEDMQNAMCVVLCNLKAKKLADYMSHGMVLCAETPDRLQAELLKPPEGSQPGDVIVFEGYERRPPDALNPKKNPRDNVQPKLSVNSQGIAVFEDIPFLTSNGPVTAKSIRNGGIH